MIGLAVALIAGIPAARLADRDAPLLRLLGEAMLAGIAICGGVLFALSCAGVAWTFARAIAIVLLITVALTFAHRAKPIRIERLHWLDLLTIATLAGYALFATIAAPPEIDFIASWGLKGATFAEHGGIDWSFLQNQWYRFDHPDYPPLLPLTFDFMTLASGRWTPETLGWVNPFLALALILILRSLLADDMESPLAASAATLVIAPLAMAPWIGIAEGPLIAFGTAGVLLARRKMTPIAAILLGCAGMTKNEGLALLASVVIALLLTRRFRDVLRLWPAALIALPWIVIRRVLALHTDFIAGPMFARALERLRNPGELIAAFGTYTTGLPLLWVGIAAAIVLGVRKMRDESFVLAAVAVQFVTYFGVYLITEKDVAWHIRWSWERLVAHETATLAFVGVVLLYRFAMEQEA